MTKDPTATGAAARGALLFVNAHAARRPPVTASRRRMPAAARRLLSYNKDWENITRSQSHFAAAATESSGMIAVDNVLID